jgi:hypothetical protein
LDLGKDLVRCLFVLVCKPGVDLDSIREVGKERGIGGNAVEVNVGMNGQTVKAIFTFGSS